MDVSTRNYTTIMRSHTGMINCMALDSMRRHLATVSEDHTIRVWDCDTMQQVLEVQCVNIRGIVNATGLICWNYSWWIVNVGLGL